MSFTYMIIVSLLIGTIFGIALEKSRVFEPGVIIGQMQFKRFTMVKVFFTGIVTGMVVLGVMSALGWFSFIPESLPLLKSLFGGLILGAGVSLSGACPATILVQAGVGYKDAYFTILGGLFGALAYGVFKAPVDSWLSSAVPADPTFFIKWGVPYWLLAVVIATVVGGGLFVLEKWRDWRVDLGGNGDGV